MRSMESSLSVWFGFVSFALAIHDILQATDYARLTSVNIPGF